MRETGRVFALMPEGIKEIRDDLQHDFGGKEARLILEERLRQSDTIL